MDKDTWRLFKNHIRKLEAMAIAGDATSGESLACIALLVEENPPKPPDGEVANIINFSEYKNDLIVSKQ